MRTKCKTSLQTILVETQEGAFKLQTADIERFLAVWQQRGFQRFQRDQMVVRPTYMIDPLTIDERGPIIYVPWHACKNLQTIPEQRPEDYLP